MSGPESMYAAMTSGDAGELSGYADDVHAAMTTVSDAIGLIAYASDQPDWESPSARTEFNVKAWTTRAVAEVAHIRLNRLELAVDKLARDYRTMRSDATDVIEAWRTQTAGVSDAHTLSVFRRTVMLQLKVVQNRFSDQIDDAREFVQAPPLDPDDADGEPWLRNGLLRSLKYDLENPTDVGPIIPGTLATGDDDLGIKPQGLGLVPGGPGQPDLLAQTGYNGSNSVLSLIDPETGEVVNTVNLGADGEMAPDHAGGISVHGDTVWVTSSENPPQVYPYSLDDVQGSQAGDPVPMSGDPQEVAAGSYSTVVGDTMYVGDYYKDVLYTYTWDPSSNSWVDERGPFPTPPEVQGIAIRGGEVVFSTSGGRDNPSTLQSYNLGDVVPYDPADDADAIDGEIGDPLQTVDLPNLSEGVVFGPDGIITTYESGGEEYSDPDGHSLEELWASMTMTVTPFSALGLSGGIDVEPPTLHAAKTDFRAARDKLETAEDKIGSLSFPTAALGGVPAASLFSFAAGAHTLETKTWLDEGKISAGITADGLEASALSYEESDSLIEQAFDGLTGLFS